MQINNLSSTNPNFNANLIISGKNLLKKHEAAELDTLAQKIGTTEDIIEINFKSDILDWYENNQHGEITKILSGFKMLVETTLENFPKIDCSVANTQQVFWFQFEDLGPFGRVKQIFEQILNNEPQSQDSTANIRPDIYNAENPQWIQNSKIEIFEAPKKKPVKTFYNSPFYKAMTEHREIGLRDIFAENLAQGTHRINLEQLRKDISELRSGHDVRTPVTDFSTGIVYPEAEEVKSSKYIFIEGLQTQFPEIEELADLILRVEVPADIRKTSFIDRAAQGGVKKEQAEKDLEASNEYMEKLIPLNPNSADIIINGRYNKDDLIDFLNQIF